MQLAYALCMRRHGHGIHFHIGALLALQEGMRVFRVKRQHPQLAAICRSKGGLCPHLDHLISVRGWMGGDFAVVLLFVYSTPSVTERVVIEFTLLLLVIFRCVTVGVECTE